MSATKVNSKRDIVSRYDRPEFVKKRTKGSELASIFSFYSQIFLSAVVAGFIIFFIFSAIKALSRLSGEDVLAVLPSSPTFVTILVVIFAFGALRLFQTRTTGESLAHKLPSKIFWNKIEVTIFRIAIILFLLVSLLKFFLQAIPNIVK